MIGTLQAQIDWLSRIVGRRRKLDVSEVFTHLLVSSSGWLNVTVVNREKKPQAVHRAIDSPLCTACAVLLRSIALYALLVL